MYGHRVMNYRVSGQCFHPMLGKCLELQGRLDCRVNTTEYITPVHCMCI